MRIKNRTVAAILPLIAIAPLVMGAGGGCHLSISSPDPSPPSPDIPIVIATADANAFDPQIGRSIVCNDSLSPAPHGFSVQKIDGVRYLVGEVDVTCLVTLQSFAISLSVANLGDKSIHNTGSGDPPGTGDAKDGTYHIKFLCVPGSYVISYLAKVVSFDGRESWFGNVGTPLTITQDDCNQVGAR